MEKQEVLDLLKSIKPLLQENYGIKTIALFGSYSSRGTDGGK